MPYIDPAARPVVDREGAETVGELTYVLTQAVLRFLPTYPSFADYAEAVAALECTKLELYRRAVGPHEDLAALRNGDLDWPSR